MLTVYMNNLRRYFLVGGLLALGLLWGKTGYGQPGINGVTSGVQGNSYTYYPTNNGTSTYSYSGPYTWTISGGVVSGTSNTSKSGTCSGVLYTIGVNVTWTSGTGTLTFASNLGSNYILHMTAAAALQPGTLSPSSQTINYGANATITGTAATGGATSPAYSYQWQSSADNVNWTNITGATAVNYSPSTLHATTYFRRQVTETTSGSVLHQMTCLAPRSLSSRAKAATAPTRSTPSVRPAHRCPHGLASRHQDRRRGSGAVIGRLCR